MKTACYNTLLGYLHVEYENEVLYCLNVVPKCLQYSEKSDFSDKVFQQIKEYLDGKRRTFDIKYVFRGTEFQQKVWHELEKIAYGQTLTYSDVAAKIGHPAACRAVGMACNANPILVIVPCHRVIGKNGHLIGYANGLKIKEKLLQLEHNSLDFTGCL